MVVFGILTPSCEHTNLGTSYLGQDHNEAVFQ